MAGLDFLADILGAPFKALGTAATLLHNPNYYNEQDNIQKALQQVQNTIGTPDAQGITWNNTLTPQQKYQDALIQLAKADPNKYGPAAVSAAAPSSPLEELDAQMKRLQLANLQADINKKNRRAAIFAGDISPVKAPAVSAPVYGSQDSPLSVKNNNPGNIRSFNGGFRKFNTPDEGLAAMAQDLAAKVSGNSRVMQSKYGKGYVPTIQNVIETWAPPSENDTSSYVAKVSQDTGIDPSKPLTQEDVQKIIPSMINMEGGNKASQVFSPETQGPPVPMVLGGDAGIAPAYAAPVVPVQASPLDQAVDSVAPQAVPTNVNQNSTQAITPEEDRVRKLEQLAREFPDEETQLEAMKARASLTAAQAPDVEKETSIRKEFESQTAPFRTARDAYKRLQSSQDNAAGDLSLIFSYMKVLDPGSTVREGEFATAQNATGVPQQILNRYNQVISGERLSKGQRDQFKSQAKGLYESAKTSYDEISDHYKGIAKSYKMDPDRVVQKITDKEPEQKKITYKVVDGKLVAQ